MVYIIVNVFFGSTPSSEIVSNVLLIALYIFTQWIFIENLIRSYWRCWEYIIECTRKNYSYRILHYSDNNFLTPYNNCLIYPSGKEPVWKCRRHKRCGFDPWRKAWQPTSLLLPGESHGQRSLVGYSPWGCKESDMTEVTQHAHRDYQSPIL